MGALGILVKTSWRESQCRLFTISSVRKNGHSVLLYFAVLSYFIGSCSNLSLPPPYLFPFTYSFSVRMMWLSLSAKVMIQDM